MIYKEEWNKAFSSSSKDWDWKSVWSAPCHPKIQNFLWAYLWNGIPTKDSLHTRRIIENPNCPFCQIITESCIHVLRECIRAREVWLKCSIPQDFFSMDCKNWLTHNMKSQIVVKDQKNISWATLFSFLCWRIWIRRNQWVFNNKDLNVDLFWHQYLLLATVACSRPNPSLATKNNTT